MNIEKRLLAILAGGAIALVTGGGIWAQSLPQDSPGPGGLHEGMRPGGPPPEEDVGFVSFEMGLGGHKVVKGAPYSAQISVESTQELTDGTHIDRKSSGAVFRDSEGRTRREDTLPAIGHFVSPDHPLQVIFIHDPVAGVRYLLEPDKKIARKMTLGAKGGFMKEMHEHPPFEKSRIDVTSESLGTQTMEGVAVEGTRITHTIPTGQIGNDRPIEVVTERWYSPELQTSVLTKHSDPRMGTTVIQLKSINRAEPAATLFEVPADYTVKEGGPMGMHWVHRMD